MEQKKSQIELQSTNEDVSTAFARVINKKINKLTIETPTKFLDAVIRLHWLYSNIANVEFYAKDCPNLGITKNMFNLYGEQEVQEIDRTIPSSSLFNYYIQQAVEKVLNNNRTIRKLAQVTAQLLAKSINQSNQEQCLALLDKWVHPIIIAHIQNALVNYYGWNKDLIKKQTKIQATPQLLSLPPKNYSFNKKVVAITSNGHSKNVTIITPLTETLVASGSDDGTLKIWDILNEKCIETYKLDEKVNEIEVVDATKLAVLSTLVVGYEETFKEYTKLTVFDWTTGKKLYSEDVSTDSSIRLKATPGMLYVVTKRKTTSITIPTVYDVFNFLAEKNSNPTQASPSSLNMPVQWASNLYRKVEKALVSVMS